MSFPLLEFIHAAPTDAYRENSTDPLVFGPLLDIFDKTDGLIVYVHQLLET